MPTSWIVISIVIVILLILAVLIFAKKRRKQEQYNQIYVGNLPYQINEYELKREFSRFGSIEEMRIIRNSKTHRSKGYGFITFSDIRSAENALEANGQKVKGRKLVVRIAKPPR